MSINPPSSRPTVYDGVFIIGKNDSSYVHVKETDEIIEIPKEYRNHALHRDLVHVTDIDWKKGTGRIEHIIKPSKKMHVGTVERQSLGLVLGAKTFRDPMIVLPHATEKDLGTYVGVSITHWNDEQAFGEIIKRLGDPNDHKIILAGFALEKGFDEDFPPDVLKEAHELQERGIMPVDFEGRRDVRSVLTCTIDPADAKDFDDALSYEIRPDGTLEVGVHIADVSHYVIPGSALDREAKERTTSVYLVDRTISMLPEELSNDLCSLKPHVDRLTMSAFFIINPQTGEVLDRSFGKTVIHSDKRFTYEEAQAIIERPEGPFAAMLTTLNTLAKKYTQERLDDGALSLEQDEVKFILDEAGVPLKVLRKERFDAHKLIEEFMLLANRHVTEFIVDQPQAIPFIYRIHDRPTPEKTEELRLFLKNLGYRVHMKHGVITPESLRALVEETASHDVREALSSAIVKSMAKAIYSTTNIGHYGLAFPLYTHFTSPIRRYPDVMVHRIVAAVVSGTTPTQKDAEDFEIMAAHSSQREREAQEAEWASIKYKQVQYMAARIGNTYQGIVTGMNKYGLFIAEKESRSEGMVRLSDIPGDYFFFDDTKRTIRGKKSKKTYTIGDTVTIRVKDAQLSKQMIDYTILPTENS